MVGKTLRSRKTLFILVQYLFVNMDVSMGSVNHPIFAPVILVGKVQVVIFVLLYPDVSMVIAIRNLNAIVNRIGKEHFVTYVRLITYTSSIVL